jgi:MFS superfamily sulfate permease-like transporter
MSSQPTSNCGDHKPWLTRLVPALDWLAHYERKQLPGDALAGVIVATLLIPQAMAYALPQTRWPTVAISIASVLLLLAFQYLLPRVLARWHTFPAALAQSLSKSGPIIVVIVGTAIVAAFHLGARHGVSIIGEIPSGLPRFALPALARLSFCR